MKGGGKGMKWDKGRGTGGGVKGEGMGQREVGGRREGGGNPQLRKIHLQF